MKSFPKFSAAALVAAFAVTTSANAGAILDFANNDPFDSGANPGGAEDRADTTLVGVVGSQSGPLADDMSGLSAVVTTIDIIGADGTSAADGTGTDDFHETNVLGSGFLGVNTDQDQDDGLSNDAGNFNPNEGWVFNFSNAVELTSIVLGGFTATEQVAELQFNDGSAAIALGAGIFDEDAGTNTIDLGARSVAAGTEITLSFVSTTGDDTFNVGSIGFNVVPDVVVPEPASIALLGLGGLAIAGRRRKQA